MDSEPGSRPAKPLLIWDGTCGFCRRWVERWRRRTGDRVEYATSQDVGASHPEVPPEAFAEAVHLIEPDGSLSRGAEAVFRTLAYAPGGGRYVWCYENVPGVRLLTETAYRFIARRRPAFSRLTDTIWGEHVIPPGERLTAWLFLRLLGVVFAIAFLSLWVQIRGLAGTTGILPVGEYLKALSESTLGAGRFYFAPTLLWLSPTEAALQFLCGAGLVLSIALAAGIAPLVCLAGAWAAYLSLATVCREFLWFQWDSLLLETGFLALFVAPLRLWDRPSSTPAPARGPVLLLRWLLFRLLFASAAVKLTSGDPSWRDLTALTYHFETQPLPTLPAWFAHHLPFGILKAMTGATLVIEGLVPFLLFGPRRIRFAAALMVGILQVAIAITGNYAFFNLLTLALCVLVLDDGVWPAALRRRFAGASDEPGRPETVEERDPGKDMGRRRWPARIRRTAVVVLFLLSLVPLVGAVGIPTSWLGPVTPLFRALIPLRVVGSYGLFAVMTKERPEIVLEGSRDGVTWYGYEFRWKPGNPEHPPAFVAPHQPRVDWQMWFAALGDYQTEFWFYAFCDKVLRGSPPVLDLLARNPFPRSPPRYIRAVVYRYRFTDAATRGATGAWWRRELRGLYCPVLTLTGGRLGTAPAELQKL